MYKRVSEQKIFRGDNRGAVIASCLYMACKTNHVPRSIKEVADMFGVRVPCMTKACKTLHELLNVQVASSSPIDFVNRFCSKLGVDEVFSAYCRSIVLRASTLHLLTEYTPPSAVAGCIMLCSDASGTLVPKKRIADVCQVSGVTISKCFKFLNRYRSKIMDSADVEPIKTF